MATPREQARSQVPQPRQASLLMARAYMCTSSASSRVTGRPLPCRRALSAAGQSSPALAERQQALQEAGPEMPSRVATCLDTGAEER